MIVPATDHSGDCLHCAITRFIIARGAENFDHDKVIGSLTQVIADIINSHPVDTDWQAWALGFANRNTRTILRDLQTKQAQLPRH